MRVRGGRIPFMDRHLVRLERWLGGLGLARPSQAVAALVRPFAGTDEAVLRVEVRDGRASVTVRDLPPLDPPAVVTASEPHVPYPHKTTERDCFVDAAEQAEVGEADDALLLTPEGWGGEGTAWDVYWGEGGHLGTPAAHVGVLPGIGRGGGLGLATAGGQGGG